MIDELKQALHQGHWPEAARLIMALDDGKSSQWPYNLGQVHAQQGQPALARAAFLDALKRDPSHQYARFEAARMALNLLDYEVAYRDLSDYAQTFPMDEDAWVLLAPLALRNGDWKAALEYGQKIADPVAVFRAKSELGSISNKALNEFLSVPAIERISALGRVARGTIPHQLPTTI